ncbi:C-type lectin domain family 4 member G-like [Archocentrus centrarchus]|uniref:C-type lectin domain family 4 member G-like n=1 Tax=Archocentrus centrarchus TaxID=63155 RepID=UPI0011EA03C2|nr:C-type lectin domain family 4 member G-like [Archocentrus centrarchus]
MLNHIKVFTLVINNSNYPLILSVTEVETVYEEMIMENKATEPDKNDKKSAFTKSCPSVAASLGILLLIMVLRIYFTTLLIRKNEKQITNLTAENKNIREKNEKLAEEEKNLREQIQHMNTTWKELCVSRERLCKPCEKGWLPFESGCYAINNAEHPEHKTWDEARENCKGKISDLAVVINAAEKTYLSDNSWGSSGNKGYWIGLRVKDGKWKWVDGSDLTDNSWIRHPPSDGLCAISVQNQGFKSVHCNNKNQWICKKNA